MIHRLDKAAGHGHTSLSIILAGVLVVGAAVTDAVLRSEVWIPLYARCLMQDSEWDFESDTIRTAPLYQVRDNYLVIPGRTAGGAKDVIASGDLLK